MCDHILRSDENTAAQLALTFAVEADKRVIDALEDQEVICSC